MADIAQLAARLGGGAPGGGMPPSPAGAPPGGGGQPPGMPSAARPNIGPVTPSQPMAGNAAAAMNDLRNAAKILEKALPSIPMGSPLHTDILKITQQLTKHLQPGDGNDGLELQSLLQMARQSAQNSPTAALNRLMGGGAGGAPGGAPGMPAGGPPGGMPAPMAA